MGYRQFYTRGLQNNLHICGLLAFCRPYLLLYHIGRCLLAFYHLIDNPAFCGKHYGLKLVFHLEVYPTRIVVLISQVKTVSYILPSSTFLALRANLICQDKTPQCFPSLCEAALTDQICEL